LKSGAVPYKHRYGGVHDANKLFVVYQGSVRAYMRNLFKSAFLASFMLCVCACSENSEFAKSDPIDRKLNLSRNDYKNLSDKEALAARNGEVEIKAETKAPPIPSIAPILAAPRPPKIGESKLVSIAVTDDVPLKDVLIELARLADVDIELDAGIEGGVSFRAKERPFNEVIERISDLAGLRYSMKNGVLRVERDEAYIQNYSIDFLNLVRSSESTVNVATDVLALANSASGEGGGGGSSGSGGGSGGGGSSGLSTGSTSSITSKAEDDFWESLKIGISQILTYQPAGRTSSSSNGAGVPGQPQPQPQGGTQQQDAKFVLNRQAGILSVSATQKQHEIIAEFLRRLRANASAQVLIEAKIVEVSLDDEFKSGISWDALKGNTSLDVTYPGTFDAGNVTTIRLGDGNFGINLDAALQLMERFGTTRTLSSPRLHAINNQQAVLTFAENRIFFEVNVEREDSQVVDGVLVQGSTSVTSTRRSVPIGIILNIMPSIDLKNNEVTLAVRPTLSRQVSTVSDPGSALVNQLILQSDPTAEGFTNEVPVVEVRELDSILKLKSGQVMVIGGLMEQTASNEDTGVPYLSSLPWFGNLFKTVGKTGRTRELVIFIRATIVGSQGNYQDMDRTIYNTFTKDPRPLNF